MLRRGIQRLTLLPPLRDAWRRGNVVMIHIGRCGSTVLGDLLGQHPRMAWDSEIFQHVFRQKENEDHSLPPIADVDPVRYTVDRSNKVFSPYYGLEVKFFHLRALGSELGPFLDGLEAALGKMHYIVLQRENTLRMVLSTLAARHTGVWHLRRDKERKPDRFHVDIEAVFVNRENARLLELLREFSRDFAATETLLRERHTLQLTYERDIQGDPLEAYRKVCRFLDLPAPAVSVNFYRTNAVPLQDMVENFDEIRACLAGTEFEWMLDSAE